MCSRGSDEPGFGIRGSGFGRAFPEPARAIRGGRAPLEDGAKRRRYALGAFANHDSRIPNPGFVQ